LKELTRGKRIGEADLLEFVGKLDVSDATKKRLLALRPENYIGLATEVAKLVN
jgi:adenylosuccinate lyase